jgi:hypothetical protein
MQSGDNAGDAPQADELAEAQLLAKELGRLRQRGLAYIDRRQDQLELPLLEVLARRHTSERRVTRIELLRQLLHDGLLAFELAGYQEDADFARPLFFGGGKGTAITRESAGALLDKARKRSSLGDKFDERRRDVFLTFANFLLTIVPAVADEEIPETDDDARTGQAEDPVSTEDPAPVESSAPAEDFAAGEDPAPAEDFAAVEDPAPAEDLAAVEDPAPVPLPPPLLVPKRNEQQTAGRGPGRWVLVGLVVIALIAAGVWATRKFISSGNSGQGGGQSTSAQDRPNSSVATGSANGRPTLTFDDLGGGSSIINVYPGVEDVAGDKLSNGTYQNGNTASAVCKISGRLVRSNTAVGERSNQSSTWIEIAGTPGIMQFASLTYATMPQAQLNTLPTCQGVH